MGEDNEKAAKPSAPTVGLIIPPPEIRNIVNKTSVFVAKNGWQFTERIRREKAGESKFNFLQPTSPYHAYFLHMIEEIKAGRAKDIESTYGMDEEEDEQEVEEDDVVKEPEPFHFADDPPPISVLDLDVLKLTALYAAKNGNMFLQQLMQKEIRNHMFGFLKPQNPFHTFFKTLMAQYQKILSPPEELIAQLRAFKMSTAALTERASNVAAWDKKKEDDRKKWLDDKEADRIAFNQIDWQDFVVVETIEFTEEDTDLPPPITPDELGERVLQTDQAEREIQERLKAKETPLEAPDDVGAPSTAMDMGTDEGTTSAAAPDATTEASADDGDGQDSAAKQEEEEEGEGPGQEAHPESSSGDVETPLQGQAEETEVQIRDYDPKAREATGGSVQKEEMLTSPLTGELIPASKLQEHMRIALLDPKWREDKERLDQERAARQQAWQRNTREAMDNLKDLAERRTDIFGVGDIEAEIQGEEQENPLERLARLQATPEEQQGLLDDAIKSDQAQRARAAVRPPPQAPPSSAMPPHGLHGRMHPGGPPPPRGPRHMPLLPSPNYPPPHGRSGPGHHGPPPPHAQHRQHPSRMAPPHMRPQQDMHEPPRARPQPPPHAPAPQNNLTREQAKAREEAGRAAQQFLRPQPGNPPRFNNPAAPQRPPQMQPPMPTPQRPSGMGDSDGPPTKRSKAGFISEAVFLQTHSGSTTCACIVDVDDEGSDLTKGTTYNVTIPYTSKISDLKSMLSSLINVPASKQKLTVNGTALANTKSVAFYNISNDTQVLINLKSRGGKK